MRRSDFQRNEEFMAGLSEILRAPIMSAAIEIVKAESVRVPDPMPGVEYQAQMAMAGAFTAGVFRAFDRLESLCHPLAMDSMQLPRQTQYDAAGKARMRAAGIYTDEEISKL